ncbi:hypothetical protein LAZ67_11003281 [Cordylochernes scorpioides]|uniref:PiggyBac transposable element-derived protein 4 C-terminal zinc-ribbon domain-containing protein n=1 Tax=Cordylochernes scorpioides TaxID=51811 RepID=A0ABY6L1K4_9ARAC|nr:hypothetical protein LAZ67_11003281 [Cordylochernes scorpioides]
MVNQMCGTYSVGRRTNRWPQCLFFDLLNVAGINSEIIFKSLNINSPRIEMSVESEPKKRKRCYVCPSTKGSMTQIICYKCRRHICQRHSSNICKDCE